MKIIALLIAASITGVGFAQEAEKAPAPPPTSTEKKPDEAAPEVAKPSPADAKAADMAALEAKFKTTLTDATMSGRWCLIKDGQLTPEKPDKYTIVGVNKLFGDRWLIRARIQYGGKDITAPVPVRVKWAGDTPVITVDDVGIPGSSTYSARVVIYDDSYAGTWSGPNIRGLLSGMITREKP
jgi:hypothetical protein